MIEKIVIGLIGVVISVGGWFGVEPENLSFGAFGDPFLSRQLATGADNGECLTTDGTNNAWSASCGGGSSFGFPFTVNTGYNSTSTVIGFNGLFSTASSTFSSNVFFSSLTQGFSYIGSNGKLNTIASSSVNLSWFNNDAGFITSGGSSAFEVATTSDITQSQVAYINKTSGRTTLASVATGTITGGDSLTVDATRYVIGGNLDIDCDVASASQTGCLSTASFSKFDSATTTAGTGLTYSGNAFNVNTTQNIAKLSNLTSNGFVKTSGGDGTLSVDTTTYLSSYDAWTHPATGISATTSQLTVSGLLSTASSTFSSDLRLSSLTQGFAYIGTNGKVNSIASSSINLSWFNNDAGFITSAGNGSPDFSYAQDIGYGVTGSATSTKVKFSLGIHASSTNRFDYASTTQLSVGADWVTDLDGSGLTLTSGALDCDTASGSVFGCLSTTDWTTFNNKLSSYDAWSHPATGQSATSSLIIVNGLISNASSTIGAAGQGTGLDIRGGATTTGLHLIQGGFISQASSTIVGHATTTGTHGMAAIWLGNADYLTDINGNGLSLTAGVLTATLGTTIAPNELVGTPSAANSILTLNSAGTGFVATSSHPLYVGAIVATSTVNSIFPYSSSTIYSSFETASTSALVVSNSINIFNGGAKTSANALCIQLTGSADLCDGNDGGGGGSSAYEIATTSDIGVSQVAYISQTAGRTTLASAATSTLTCSGGATCSNVVVLGSSPTLSVFSYPFPSAATTTLLTLNGGLIANASSTIGAGGQGTGLDIRGGATTTGLHLIQGGFISQASSTVVGNSTTTGTFGAGRIFVNNDYITDFTGTGLQISGSALTLDATGDWTGTLDGFNGFGFPFTVNTGYNSTSTTIGFTQGLFSTASSTFSSSLRLPSLTQGFAYIGSLGTVNTVSTSTLAGQVFPFTSATNYNSTSTVLGLSGFFSTASSTISGDLFMPSLTQGYKYIGSNGITRTVSTSTLANQVFQNENQRLGFTYATTTWSGTTTIYMGPAYRASTVNYAYCETDTGTVGISIYDGTNRADYIKTASTTINKFNYTTNNTWTAGESMRVDIGNPASTPTRATCSFGYKVTD